MSKQRANVESILRAIEIVGGITALSLKANISYQSVIDWKSGRKTPTPTNCQKIEKATEGQVKAQDILPDYPWEELR